MYLLSSIARMHEVIIFIACMYHARARIIYIMYVLSDQSMKRARPFFSYPSFPLRVSGAATIVLVHQDRQSAHRTLPPKA